MSNLVTDSLDLDYEHLTPESLFKKIEGLKWADAVAHIRNNPYEAGRWIVKFGAGGTVTSRRLPIHEACIRKPTSEIISVLLQIYPNSSKELDNHGLLPLHHACIHDAGQDILCLLTAANPKGVSSTDEWGRSPTDCLSISKSPLKDTYIELLDAKNLTKVSMLASECHEKYSLFQQYNNASSSKVEELSRARIECASLRESMNRAIEKEKSLTDKISELEKKVEEVIRTYEERESILITDFETVSRRNTDMKFSFNIMETDLAAKTAILAEKNALIEDLKRLVDLRLIEQKENEEIVKLTVENKRLNTAVQRMTEQVGEWQRESDRLNESEKKKLLLTFSEEKDAIMLEMKKINNAFSLEKEALLKEISYLKAKMNSLEGEKASMENKIELLTDAMKCVVENGTTKAPGVYSDPEEEFFDSSSFDPQAIVEEATVQRMLLDKALTFAVLKSARGRA